MRILIVDDSRAIQIIIKRALEKGGFSNLQIKLAHSGLAALNVITTWQPDLVLTDWHMPEMSGIELLSEINRQMLTVNVGLITTETNAARLELAKQSGVKFIIHKPFEESQLLQQVMRFLPKPPSDNPINASQQTSPPHNIESTTDVEAQNPEETNLINIILPSESELEDILAETFFTDVKVRIKSDEIYEAHQYPYLLGMLTPVGEDKVKAICILKSPAIKQVSNAFATQAALKPTNNQNKERLCDYFFRLVEKFIIQPPDNSPMMLKKSNLVSKPFDKLVDLYSPITKQRKDYFIEIKGYDAFILTIVCA